MILFSFYKAKYQFMVWAKCRSRLVGIMLTATSEYNPVQVTTEAADVPAGGNQIRSSLEAGFPNTSRIIRGVRRRQGYQGQVRVEM
jgi:hypothetical protein